MKDFVGNTVDGVEDLIGDVVSSVRLTKSRGEKIQYLVLFFESGAVLSVDGRFPHDADIELPDDFASSIVGRVLEDISLVDGSAPGGSADKQMMQMTLSGEAIQLKWNVHHHDGFDVEPYPVFNVRPAPQCHIVEPILLRNGGSIWFNARKLSRNPGPSGTGLTYG